MKHVKPIHIDQLFSEEEFKREISILDDLLKKLKDSKLETIIFNGKFVALFPIDNSYYQNRCLLEYTGNMEIRKIGDKGDNKGYVYEVISKEGSFNLSLVDVKNNWSLVSDHNQMFVRPYVKSDISPVKSFSEIRFYTDFC